MTGTLRIGLIGVTLGLAGWALSAAPAEARPIKRDAPAATAQRPAPPVAGQPQRLRLRDGQCQQAEARQGWRQGQRAGQGPQAGQRQGLRDGRGPHAGQREGRRDGQGPNAANRQPQRDGQGPHGERRRERNNEDCRRR